MDGDGPAFRALKTLWFAKRARKAGILDAELSAAVEAAIRGQVVDLGGGVYKKRLDKNKHRSIILLRRPETWVFVFLFAKKDRANISQEELLAFRELAAIYETRSQGDLDAEVTQGSLLEIGHG